MLNFYNRIINFYTLAVLNILFILAAELTGGGKFFEESGLIHLAVIVLFILMIFRITMEYQLADKILKKFLRTQLIAMFFIGLVHVFEFISIHLLAFDEHLIELFLISSCLIWFLLNLLSVEPIITTYKQHEKIKFSSIFSFVIFVLILFIFITVFWGEKIGVKTNESWGSILTALTLFLAALTYFNFSKIKKMLPLLNSFINYELVTILFVVLTVLLEFSGISKWLNQIGVPEIQTEYIGHFTYFMAISILLLGFGKLLELPGIYNDIPEKTKTGN